jgi:hypothetical protein
MRCFKIILFCCICSGYCFGQKQIKYCQIGLSPYGSNCYILTRSKNQPKKGTFERIEEFDDGQELKGKGTYVKHNNKIVFSQFMRIRKVYSVKRDSILKCDTSIVPAQTFYKHGNHLLQYFKSPGKTHTDTIIYSTIESELH